MHSGVVVEMTTTSERFFVVRDNATHVTHAVSMSDEYDIVRAVCGIELAAEHAVVMIDGSPPTCSACESILRGDW